jgi:colanic acid/amylovoran biosynthesis glycosyltransferase
VSTVAYLANQFPAAVEPYVGEEIEELRRRGVQVIAGSVRKPDAAPRRSVAEAFEPEILFLQPVRVLTLLRALGFAARRWKRIADLLARVLLRGKESPKRRVKALLHTWLGACYAFQLQTRGVDHIHVHHGYFGAWIAMVAARLLGVNYSLTLHGSDLLVNGAYLDTKLENCRFCITISEFNRSYILEHFPAIDARKIVVSRLGVDVPEQAEFRRVDRAHRNLILLAVGRLHVVKDHAFLVRACARLRDRGLDFECAIAGDGPERHRLERLIRQDRLRDRVALLGHVPREQMDSLYRGADVVVLTSRSEGIPLVLMEAMARGRVVLAPTITGIPELVVPGRTGFLYTPGELGSFVGRILFLHELVRKEDRFSVSRLDWNRHAARVQIVHNFSRKKNLTQLANRFLNLIATQDLANKDLATQDFPHKDFVTHDWSSPHEDSVLQQI